MAGRHGEHHARHLHPRDRLDFRSEHALMPNYQAFSLVTELPANGDQMGRTVLLRVDGTDEPFIWRREDDANQWLRFGERGPQGETGPQGRPGRDASIKDAWPVQSVYFTMSDAPPEKIFGFGKWKRLESGIKSVNAWCRVE